MAIPGSIPVAGQGFQTGLQITQIIVAAGAGATFSNANSATLSAGGICTFTSNAAHGLTLTPTAPAPPNYFVMFGGSTSGITGTGILVGNIFRILSIPSTTTFTFWSTISTATVTSTTVIPVFFPPFIAGPTLGNTGGPTQTILGTVTAEPYPSLGWSSFFIQGNSIAGVYFNPDNKAIGLDSYTTPAAGTPATAPQWLECIGFGSTGAYYGGAYPFVSVQALGTSAGNTAYLSVQN